MSKVNNFMFMLFYSGMNDNGMKPLIFINHNLIGFMFKIKLIEDIDFNLTKVGVGVTIFKNVLEFDMTWLVKISTT